jgi:hypothetical protein
MKFAPMLLVVVLGWPLAAEAQDPKLKELLKEPLATPVPNHTSREAYGRLSHFTPGRRLG